MKSVGEAMAIGRSFQESFQKALRSLENDMDGIDELNESFLQENRDDLEILLSKSIPERVLIIGEAIRKKISIETIKEITGLGLTKAVTESDEINPDESTVRTYVVVELG